ncbi:MAG TPA: MarR family transcriptional regulator [Pararhizobium sp.]|nr:MarR family transcriptional regulator [Pararhizobium sp.]
MTNQDVPKSITGFGFLLADTHRVLRRRFEQRAEQYNLTSAQWRALKVLSLSSGLTQVALANRLEIEPMTVCRLVDRMEAAGFVRRLPNPADKRAKLVCLTDRSVALLDAMRPIALAVYEEAFEGLDDAERTALIGALKKINQNLSARVQKREEEPA